MKKLLARFNIRKFKPKNLFSWKYWPIYTLLFIMLVGIFFRFYNTPGRYGYDFDPTRDALVVDYGAENLQFPLVGPKSGIAPFTFGPWYYYQLILFDIVTPFDYAPWIYIGITSIITIFILYKIGALLEDKKLGLIMAALGALSPAELGPITGLSNPNLIPLQASLALYIFILFFKKKPALFWSFLWGITIGIGINNHYQMLAMMVLPVIAFALNRDQVMRKIVWFGIGLFITFIPLLAFNLLNNWHTVRGFLFFAEEGRNAAANRWLFYVRDFWPSFWAYVLGVPRSVGFIFLAYTISIGAYFLSKKQIPKIYIILFGVFIINFLALRYTTGIRENYYFIYLHPFIFLFFGWVLWKSISSKMSLAIAIVLYGILLFFTLKEDIRRLSPELRYGELRAETNAILNQYPGESFAVYRCGIRGISRAQAIAFFLDNEGRLSDNGRKIGFQSDDCEKRFSRKGFDERRDHLLFNTVAEHWYVVNPETTYNATAKWWYDEKP